MKKIIIVAGARPNFMKIAPLMHELENHKDISAVLVHTGQHYDEKMSHLFFKQLDIPKPHINLEVGSASHAVQTARIMEGFEKVCLNEKPDMVLVVGDVNSTAACTIVAAKLHISTCHYEAGLRSNDRSMPEEINRLITDAITDLYLTTSEDASKNLVNEGVDKTKIHMVGNLMIDNLIEQLPKAEKIKHNSISDILQSNYAVLTFHRPSNVDNFDNLNELVEIWIDISKKINLFFPVHPRTKQNLQKYKLYDKLSAQKNIYLSDSLGYLEFLSIVKNASLMLTDSGGIQEETTWLNIPCLTLRPTTERPITIWEGSNKLIKISDIPNEIDLILEGRGKEGKRPKYWDGGTSRRIVQIIKDSKN